MAACWIFSVPTYAQEGDLLDQKIAAISKVDLSAELEAAQLFQTLDSAQVTFNQTRFCGQFLDIADETAAELEQLNLVRNKTSESYGRRANEVKLANTEAIRDYESCYDNLLPGFEAIEKAGIYTYSAFGARYDELVGNYDDVANLDAYIQKLKAAIEAAASAENPCSPENRSLVKHMGTAPSDVVGTIRNTHKIVEVLPLSRGNRWKRVCPGYQLRLKDAVRTGPRGRARIQFKERFDGDSHVVNMGSGTHLIVEKFAIRADPREKTILQMIRGSMRALTSGLGQDFQVRTGATLCGIRGTEVAINYDPTTDVADYVLDHGDAYYRTSDGPEVILQERTGVTVTRGRVSMPRAISEADWQGLVQQTSLPFGVGRESLPLDTHTEIAEPPPPTDAEIRQVFAKMQRRRAKGLARTYLDGLMNADRKKIDRVLAGNAKTSFNQQLGAQSLEAAMQASGGRPVSYEMQCVACDESDACEVTAFVRTAQSPPGLGATILFSTARMGEQFDQGIFEMTGDPAKVDAFRQKNPVCIDE